MGIHSGAVAVSRTGDFAQAIVLEGAGRQIPYGDHVAVSCVENVQYWAWSITLRRVCVQGLWLRWDKGTPAQNCQSDGYCTEWDTVTLFIGGTCPVARISYLARGEKCFSLTGVSGTVMVARKVGYLPVAWSIGVKKSKPTRVGILRTSRTSGRRVGEYA